jgi:hypothetical protein
LVKTHLIDSDAPVAWRVPPLARGSPSLLPLRLSIVGSF